MPQRRQEQTVERKKKEGEGSKERERSTLRQWITTNARKQVGRGSNTSHSEQSIIQVPLMLKLNILCFKMCLFEICAKSWLHTCLDEWVRQPAQRHSLTRSISHPLAQPHLVAHTRFFISQSLSHSDVAVRDSEWGDSTERTPVREKGAVYSTCTFYEQFLPMTTQQCPGQKGGKVHKNLPQQGGHFLQSTLQFCGDAASGNNCDKN